ncbi:DUF4287 domain-containing protein [Nocardioides sp. zg-579]|uniref:DUF4287 domain-containing protein n=1 Tax=Nocardioides marmotae TaxID=2663857 RepID=A0A6I3JCV9_9ACTN|nr:DUF4287 domain-containing protein [Nocardioides marmotae]MCR6032310.1 DUF4287 domain-containing protein [Gordonia jinghuaiqii]MTB95958.1 DUF4287 domain-containing protein [Nocardioides marmotae]QKE02709.1 DUF4287 domain-containing protein [Nocardioides marmotae]
MSFQAYLDKAEEQTGLTPRQLVQQANEHGLDASSRSGEVIAWFKAEHGLGHGHAAALAHVVVKGPRISDKHVGSTGSHRDESDTLWLDGRATRPGA